MKRVGFLLKVKANRLDEYKEHHRRVWPEMLEALRESGWHNYSLFLREDGLLFGYFESPNGLAQAQAFMEQKDANTHWQQFMAPYFEENVQPDQSFVELEEIFHLD